MDYRRKRMFKGNVSIVYFYNGAFQPPQDLHRPETLKLKIAPCQRPVTGGGYKKLNFLRPTRWEEENQNGHEL